MKQQETTPIIFYSEEELKEAYSYGLIKDMRTDWNYPVVLDSRQQLRELYYPINKYSIDEFRKSEDWDDVSSFYKPKPRYLDERNVGKIVKVRDKDTDDLGADVSLELEEDAFNCSDGHWKQTEPLKVEEMEFFGIV